MSARENILARIREANGGKERANDPGTILARLDARVRGPLPTMEWETQTRFRERCIAMMSTIGEAESIVEVPRAVASYLKEKNLPTSGACWPEFAALDWAGAGLAVEAWAEPLWHRASRYASRNAVLLWLLAAYAGVRLFLFLIRDR